VSRKHPERSAPDAANEAGISMRAQLKDAFTDAICFDSGSFRIEQGVLRLRAAVHIDAIWRF
jgi:hypothetical protein